MHRWTRHAVAALSMTAAACATSGGPLPPARPIETINYAPSLDVNFARMSKTPGGVYYRDIELGNGPVIKARDDLKVHYTGWLTNGVQFDANTNDQPPLTVPFGRGRVIKGWDEGLVGMRVGGRRQLIVPSELGYGSAHAGVIPPDAVLVFDIRILSAK